MKSKLLNWGITTKIVLSVSSILIMIVVFIFFINKNIDRYIGESNSQNSEIDKINDKILDFSKINNDLALLVKDVSYTSVLAQNYMLESQYRYETERIRIWEKRMNPLINQLENEFEYGYNDEIKEKYNTVIDQIIESKSIQESVLESYNSENITVKIKDLNEAFRKVSENYDAFVAIKQQDQIRAYNTIKIEYDSYFYWILCFLILLIFIIVYNLNLSLLKPISIIKKNIKVIHDGDIPYEIILENEDYKPLVRSINYLSKMLMGVKDFALKVGEGKFEKDETLLFGGHGTLGESLSYMQDSLMKVAEEDRQRNHINEGLAKFSEILGKNTNSLERFGDETILNLIKFLDANQGAIFVVNDDDAEDQYLDLIASYAYNKKKYTDVKIVKGQGLVGQSWQEMKRIYMTDVPKNYVNITSGLGYSTPRCILIVPLIFNEEIHGVIELASFHALKDYELGFIEKVSESISSALASVKVNTKTQRLLAQSEEIALKMRQQEEETQKTLTELVKTQKESQDREEQNLREIKRLKKRLDEYERNF